MPLPLPPAAGTQLVAAQPRRPANSFRAKSFVGASPVASHGEDVQGRRAVVGPGRWSFAALPTPCRRHWRHAGLAMHNWWSAPSQPCWTAHNQQQAVGLRWQAADHRQRQRATPSWRRRQLPPAGAGEPSNPQLLPVTTIRPFAFIRFPRSPTSARRAGLEPASG